MQRIMNILSKEPKTFEQIHNTTLIDFDKLQKLLDKMVKSNLIIKFEKENTNKDWYKLKEGKQKWKMIKISVFVVLLNG